MKLLVCLLFLALLPALCSAGYYWNADTNSLVWEDDVPDVNIPVVDLNTGPIMLKIQFEHTIIGTGDLNAKGWFFDSSKDYAFNIEAPSLENFYVLDFKTNDVYVYEGIAPIGWQTILSLTNNSANFRVNNLLGDCDGDLFILAKKETSLNITHLEVGEWNTLVSVGLTDFFLMFDADNFGICTFSLELDEIEIGVSVSFNEMPSYWAFVETKGFACEDNPEHRCLKIPGTGEDWDIDACLDPENEKNKIVGDVPGIELCIQGSLGYNVWYRETLERKLKVEQEARVLAESKSDPELATKIGELQADIAVIITGLASAAVSADEDSLQYLLAAIVFMTVLGGAFVFSKVSLPMQSITHIGNNIKNKLEEVRKNEDVRKEEGRSEVKGGREGERGKVGESTRSGTRIVTEERLSWAERRRRRRS